MLTLVGLGLFDEKDLTLRGIEVAKSADKIYLETYTSNWQGKIENLENILGKEISALSRIDLEDNSKLILDEAKTKHVVIFVGGDPLVATTHSSILLGARKSGVETKVVHNASIVSAIAETGLHVYKFGATVTIPFLEKTKGTLPESVYRTIAENKNLGLHTLCLLDIADGSMTINKGLNILLQLGKNSAENLLDENSEAVVFSIGEKSSIVFGKISELLNANIDFLPAVIILPGSLHFTEREFLHQYKLI